MCSIAACYKIKSKITHDRLFFCEAIDCSRYCVQVRTCALKPKPGQVDHALVVRRQSAGSFSNTRSPRVPSNYAGKFLRLYRAEAQVKNINNQ